MHSLRDPGEGIAGPTWVLSGPGGGLAFPPGLCAIFAQKAAVEGELLSVSWCAPRCVQPPRSCWCSCAVVKVFLSVDQCLLHTVAVSVPIPILAVSCRAANQPPVATMFTARKKIQKEKNAEPSEFEESVAQVRSLWCSPVWYQAARAARSCFCANRQRCSL